MKDNYTYPIVLDYDEDGIIYIKFPDFKYASTYVASGEDYVVAAQEYLVLLLEDYECEGKETPNPSIDFVAEPNQKVVYINVWMPYHRTTIKEVFVKKTLTIPSWLNLLAKENHINFSAILTKALKKELNIGS